MSYVVLARKWRPQSFEDLVGQEHVSTTIANAIQRDRVAHAFLFTGVRGVGKTTSARILAKALNCAEGPTPTPCQKCPQCVEITNGNDVDVQEIDGASYTGVDDVRKLQESLPYRPQRDRFKIIIVDEVHMLSVNAWNAFLKTLEEPPPHVKFIFATTEVHKVPVTILSRCQRYDFKLISAMTIAGRLKWVLEQEKIGAEDGAVATIAREAAGSMRDAMSLLDQVIAWVGTSGDKLTAEGVARVLGVADRQVLHRLSAALVDGDPAACVRIVGELAQEGYDIPHVAKSILAQLRDLAVAKVCDEPAKLLDLAQEEIADVSALAARAEPDDLVRLHQGFSKAFDEIVRGGQPRASLEMALIRLARRPPLVPVDELLRRLSDLERRLGGAPTGGGGGGAARGGAPGAGRGAPPGRGGYEGPRAAEAQVGAAQAAPVMQAAPTQAAAVPQEAPAKAAPVVQEAPKQAAPVVREAPTQAAPAVQEAPTMTAHAVQEAPMQAAPAVQEAPTKAASAGQEAPMQAAPPVQEAPMQAAPVMRESPTKEAPAMQEAPTKVAPAVQEVPSQVAPVMQESPTKKAPAVQTTPAKVQMTQSPPEAPKPPAQAARPSFEAPPPGAQVTRPTFEAPPPGAQVSRPAFEAPAPGAQVSRPSFDARPSFEGPPSSGQRFTPPPQPPAMGRPVSTPPPSMSPDSASGQPSRNNAPPNPLQASPSLRPEQAPPTRPATDDEIKTWRAILAVVRKRRQALASVLAHAQIFDMGAERVTLGYEQTSFLYAQATENAAKELLTSVVRAHFGAQTEVAFEIAVGRSGTTIADLDTRERKAKQEAAKREVAAHPLVVAAIHTLGAELIDVRLMEVAEAAS